MTLKQGKRLKKMVLYHALHFILFFNVNQKITQVLILWQMVTLLSVLMDIILPLPISDSSQTVAPASMWTRRDIQDFKESIRKEGGDSVIKVGHGETVTVSYFFFVVSIVHMRFLSLSTVSLLLIQLGTFGCVWYVTVVLMINII